MPKIDVARLEKAYQQVNLVQLPIKGLTYQVAYTWSKSIDNGSNTFQESNESVNNIGSGWPFDYQVTSVGTPIAPTANTSRQIQLGLRLLF